MGSQFDMDTGRPDPSSAFAAKAWAVVAGGGTGGHVVPALAIAQALVARGHPSDTIHFVGSARGMEARLVPDAGFRITLLPGRGIQRRLTFANVGAVVGLVRAVLSAIRLMRRLQPRVVVSVGGYASVAASVAAVVCRVPLVLHEQNAVPGAANRLVSRFARACAISVPGTPLPRAEMTGNPVRHGVLSTDRSYAGKARARERLGIPHARRVVGVFGGSLGARRLNTAVAELVALWSGREDVAIRHVVGSRDWASFSAPEAGSLLYQPVEYEDDMPLFYAGSDVVVCRAGGATVAELAAVGAPSLMVPLPGAPGDHQTANAKAFAERGAAVLVPDGECTGERLAAELDPLLHDAARLDEMGKAAVSLARPDAAALVAELVERHART